MHARRRIVASLVPQGITVNQAGAGLAAYLTSLPHLDAHARAMGWDVVLTIVSLVHPGHGLLSPPYTPQLPPGFGRRAVVALLRKVYGGSPHEASVQAIALVLLQGGAIDAVARLAAPEAAVPCLTTTCCKTLLSRW